jgi:hypothetical protein
MHCFWAQKLLNSGDTVNLNLRKETEMITLEFYDPSGAVEVTQPHAPRLASLHGKRIGLLSNNQWPAYRTIPLIKTMLEEDFPDSEILPPDSFPQGVAAIASEETALQLKTSGIDAVIIGNAA